jgi:Zn-dependent M28 family amino/carboxypeptidase
VYPSRGDYIVVVGRVGDAALVRRVKRGLRAGGGRVESINAPRSIPGIDFSDHANYWDAGMPAVMITDTSFYRNPRYHTASDTPDTLDYLRMAQVVEGVAATVHEL